jgi:serine/threonine protein kinase
MTTFGRYEIIRELGRGGMGVVFQARDTDLGREVALKVMRPDSLWTDEQSTDFRARFEIEAKATAALHHPNIVTLFDRGEVNGLPFMAMAFVDGETLEEVLKKQGRFGLHEMIHILRPVANALDFAHSKGVIHRDIKPPNIMIQHDGHVLVMDFGIAKAVNFAPAESSRLFGSPRYMAPEQLRFEVPTKGIDQWSLGVVAYEMLAGHAPFPDASVETLCYAILNSEPAALEGSGQINPAIARALAKQPGWRHESCTAFVDALAAPDEPQPGRVTIPAKYEPPPAVAEVVPTAAPKADAFWFVAVGLISILVAGAGLFFIFRSGAHLDNPNDRAGGVEEGPHRPHDSRSTPARVASKLPEGLLSLVNPKDELTYVWVPRGRFRMGCSDGDFECQADEHSIRERLVKQGFWLSQTEVTQRAWKRIMGTDPSHFKGDDLPVESVDFKEAQRYCAGIGGRLPTEVEWEYAARAGSIGRRYGDPDAISWSQENSSKTTHAVGTKDSNSFGIYDMLGNVQEWTATLYSADLPNQVVRGGSWKDNSTGTRASSRTEFHQVDSADFLGFRCIGPTTTAPSPVKASEAKPRGSDWFGKMFPIGQVEPFGGHGV